MTFVGRDKELVAITEAMRDYQAPVLLQGMGGMGKSALMSHWVHKAFDGEFENINYQNVIAINCSNGIETGFITDENLLEALGLKHLTTDDDPNKLQRIISVLMQLDNLLLVLDDLPYNESSILKSRNELNRLSILPTNRCHIMATSRSKRYSNFDIKSIVSLPLDKCIDLFLVHSDASIKLHKADYYSEITKIVTLAGSHTLLIELLSKLAEAVRYTPVELLNELQDNKFNIEGEAEYDKDNTSFEENINTALGKLFVLARLDETQKHILYHISLMDSQVITFDLLLAWLDEIDKKSILNKLVKSGWLQMATANETAEDSHSRYFRMHQVISHAVCSQFCDDYINNEARYEFVKPVIENMESYYRQFDAHIIGSKDNISQSKREQINLTFLLAIVSYTASNMFLVGKELFKYLISRLNFPTALLDNDNNFTDKGANPAQSIKEQVNPTNLPAIAGYIRSSIGLVKESKSSKLLVNHLNRLAFFLYNNGVYALGITTLKDSIEHIKQSIGRSHPDYAISAGNLASLYRNTGNYEQALPLYKQALAVTKQSLGETHPDYAISVGNLAGLYKSIGDYEQALPLYKQAMEIKKQSLGETHPEYATSLNNLADLYRIIGDYEQALPLCEQALAIRKQSLGETHPSYATSLNNLAGLYKSTGEYDKALSSCEQALEIVEKALGVSHPNTQIVRDNYLFLEEKLE